MRVIHVETGRHLYGGPRQVLLLSDGLAQRGHDNILVCPTGSAVGRAASSSIEVIEWPMRGDLDLSLAWRLRRLVRARRPDIVHLHSRRGADWVGVLGLVGTTAPVVLSRRVAFPERAAIARLRYNMVDAVIGISARIAEQLREIGVADEKRFCVRSAVPPMQFGERDRDWLAAEFGIQHGEVVIGIVAQLIEAKCHRHLFEAVAQLRDDYPQLRILVLGRGALRPALESQVADLGLADAVVFAGFRDDLENILPNLDLLVHPAPNEGLGISVLQAAVAGVPIIAANAGGLPEIVEDERSGLLFPVGDTAAIASAIARLVDDPALAQRLGQAAAAHVQEQFSVDQMVAGNLAVYRRLAGCGDDRLPA
ncbi:MAG: glycosyltransferase family 4 protein [Gammaproteobacteria bacterium]|nr:glycosyltransferase family 4 protein [Gammaproteobacteria bacterium]